MNDDYSEGPRGWWRVIALLAAMILMHAVVARADAVVLVGTMTADGARPSFGVAFGHCPSVAGYEVEYLGTFGRDNTTRSSAGGVFGNLIVHPVTL